jgi:hypothetical protein
MTNRLFVPVLALALSLFGGCAQQQDAATPALLSSVCVMSGEALDADAPTSDHMGGKVGFCCEKCQNKWLALDDAGRKTAFEQHKK